MKLSFPSFAQWRMGVMAALMRFPWNILCGALGAASMIVLIHTEHGDWLQQQCRQFAMAAALGMPLFFSLRMLRERAVQFVRWPVELLGIALLALWIGGWPQPSSNWPGIVWIRWLLLLAMLHFFAAISAYIHSNERNGFWQFNRRLFLRFCVATLYTAVLTVGLELALLSADKLFDLKLDRAYGDLWFLMIGLFHPAFFLGGVPRDFAALNSDEEYPRGLKAFTQFALAPLVAVYTAILYAYAIKIIIVRTWPHGWVALPVLLLSGIGILAFLLLYPLQRQPEEKWAGWFTTNFPRALGPLSILLLLSVHVRVREYGVTEGRYIGIVAAVWILAWSLVFVLRRNSGIRWIPSSLAIIALVSAFGPLSAGALSKTSQLHRLERMLQAHSLWQDNHARPSARSVELSNAETTDLRTTLSYLIGTHGGNTIQGIFGSSVFEIDWAKLNSWEGTRDILSALRIETHDSYTPSHELITANRATAGALKIQGFRTMCSISLYLYASPEWRPVTCNGFAIGLEDGALKIADKTDASRQPLQIDSLLRGFPSKRTNEQLRDDELTFDFMHGTRAFRIVFNSIGFRCEPQGCRVVTANFYLMEK